MMNFKQSTVITLGSDTVFSFIYLSAVIFGDGTESLTRIDDSEYSACGPCCLYAACVVTGRDVEFEGLFKKFKLGPNGETSLSELSQVARSVGLHPVAARIDSSWINSLPCPFIAHLDRPAGKADHFVLVLGVTPKGVVLLDPPKIAELHSVEGLSKQWTGNVLVLASSENSARDFENRIRWESLLPALNLCLIGISFILLFCIGRMVVHGIRRSKNG